MAADVPSGHNLPLDILNFHKQFTTDLEHFGLKDSDSDDEESTDIPEDERPVTPIELAVKKPPKTIYELKELIHKRFHIRDDIPTVSTQDQMELASVLMSETSAIWPDMRQQAPDPFLSAADNKELERRVAIKVVTTVEDLFSAYARKLQEANAKGIFSSSANVSRLKTQLSFEANKSLNILNIRRKLASALRHPDADDDAISEDSFIFKVRERITDRTKIKPVGRIARKLQMTRMHAEELYRQLEIKDLADRMPDLDMTKMPEAESPPPCMTTFGPKRSILSSAQSFSHSLSVHKPIEDQLQNETTQTGTPKDFEEDGKLQFRLQKSHSLQPVDTAELFLEELELTRKDVKPDRKGSLERLPIYAGEQEDGFPKDGSLITKSPREDLEDLMQKEMLSRKVDEGFDLDEDMPPLLQALPTNQKSRKYPNNESKKISELFDGVEVGSVASTISTTKAVNPELEVEKGDRSVELPPQPAVVSKRFTKKNIVRASDVRVSNRESASHVTLKIHQPVYNSFKGEIDDAAIKRLDRNLFAGDEIKEVYEEVVKTINKVHLEYDQDDYVIKCPKSLDESAVNSVPVSDAKEMRILNKDLIGKIEPPWDKEGADDWRNSPKFGGLGRQEILKMKANGYKELNAQGNTFDTNTFDTRNQKKPVKSYAAWLAWWRSTINSEDYYKYISTKENDFLLKIFHLYDSEDEDENAEGSSKSLQEDPETIARKKMIQEKQEKLQAAKKMYKDGFWNVNTIYLGGLGKDPNIEDESVCLLDEEDSINLDQRRSETSDKFVKATDIASDLIDTLVMKDSDNEMADYLPPPQLTLQDRLERVWHVLKMPENQRVDMAIKYSMDENSKRFPEAIQCWETAASSVVEREELISALENFERTASDPNRFFVKGSKCSSLYRMEESKTREALHKQLARLDASTKIAISNVKKNFKDVVTYQGRAYREKMNSDKIEMLYWLQQERRAVALENAILDRKGKKSELPPIATMTLL